MKYPLSARSRGSRCAALVASGAALLVPLALLAQDGTARPSLEYESATSDYRSLDDDADPTPWRESNDTVGAIGGWRNYAKEAYESEPADDADAAASPDATAASPLRAGPEAMASDGAAMGTDAPAGPATATDADTGADKDAPRVGVVPLPEPIRKLQESTAARRGDRPQGDPADASAERRPAIEYESAFDAYEMFEESEGPDWVGSNETVGRIGGWKTYARELYESASGDELNDGDQR